MRAVLQVQELGKRRAGRWRGGEPGGGTAVPRRAGRSGPRAANAPFLLPRQWVASIDLAENADANASVVVRATDSFPEQAEQVGRWGAAGAG